MIKTINLKDYETFNIVKKSSKYIKVKAKTGPSKITKIPLYFNEELAFLIGIILGDGHVNYPWLKSWA